MLKGSRKQFRAGKKMLIVTQHSSADLVVWKASTYCNSDAHLLPTLSEFLGSDHIFLPQMIGSFIQQHLFYAVCSVYCLAMSIQYRSFWTNKIQLPDRSKGCPPAIRMSPCDVVILLLYFVITYKNTKFKIRRPMGATK